MNKKYEHKWNKYQNIDQLTATDLLTAFAHTFNKVAHNKTRQDNVVTRHRAQNKASMPPNELN